MRSGFVAVVGRPNVGKSTLVNAMVGEKVSITSSKPQTTRSTIRGVVNIPAGSDDPTAQIVLVDTPGLHKPRTALGERLNRMVGGSLAEADAIVFVLDATGRIGPGDRLIAERVAAIETPVVVVVNKTDIGSPANIAEHLTVAGEWGFGAYVPLSAKDGEGVALLIGELQMLLPEGPPYFPPGMVSDQPEGLVVGEIIREKFLERLRDELPHSLVVRVEEIEERTNGVLAIAAKAIVERDSQRGIVLGKGGAVLRDAGTEARHELEARFGTRVFLDIRVKVEKDWQQRPQLLDRLGFDV